MRIGTARSEVEAFVQNVHHFGMIVCEILGPPIRHVALFDERLQRAWDLSQTSSFMRRKKNIPGLQQLPRA